jgi:hypothetical protein
MPIHDPFTSPYFWMACSVYREQLGSNRQEDGNHAKTLRYSLIAAVPKATPGAFMMRRSRRA